MTRGTLQTLHIHNNVGVSSKLVVYCKLHSAQLQATLIAIPTQDAAVPPQREAALLQPGEAAGGLQAVGLVHPLGLAPNPRTRQGQAAVDGGINHKTYLLELTTQPSPKFSRRKTLLVERC